MPKLKSPLSYAREAAELSQHELAAKVGVSRSTIAMIETGRMAPSLDVLEHLAKALRLDIQRTFRMVRRTMRWRTRIDALKEPLRVA